MICLSECLPSHPRVVALLLVSVCALTFSSCSRQEEVRQHEEPADKTSEAAQPAPTVDLKSATPGHPVLPAVNPALAGSQLTYSTPEGWLPGKVGGMRKAAFRVGEGKRRVDITVIDLAAMAGELLPNVNRWRQQLLLGELTKDQLKDTVQPIDIAGVKGHYVELIGPKSTSQSGRAILAAVAVIGNKAWFFKLWGDSELALLEKERFQNFVKSVTFTTANAAEHAKSDLDHKDSGSHDKKHNAEDSKNNGSGHKTDNSAHNKSDGSSK